MGFTPRLIIGIDQTGAAQRGGLQAKPLSFVAFKKQSAHRWALVGLEKQNKLPLLSGLTHECIEEFVFGQRIPMSDVLIVVDSVLGLPMESKGIPSELWTLFRKAAAKDSFGLKTSQEFFSQFLKPSQKNSFPTRLCERMASANSVFAVRPAQRNIQTGTFRIWKDLGHAQKPWIKVWPFDGFGETSGPWLMEGYPSLIWKKVFGYSRRDIELLTLSIHKEIPKVDLGRLQKLKMTPDHADALLLALGAIKLHNEKRLFLPFPWFSSLPQLQTEGWIMGLTL